ncbi:MAG: hypothetical protein U5L00_13990 [Desulfovermiculus sp.]|nr:hypothetical protein [Desulfovermiculus sp.]
MIKPIFDLIKSPHIFLPVALISAGLFIISIAWSSYQEQSQRSLPNSETAVSERQESSGQEVGSLFKNPQDLQDTSLEVIAQKNLFSPERKAWQPPAPKDSEKNEEENQESQDDRRASQRLQRIDHSKIRLHGTTITDTDKMALMFMDPFESKHKYRLAREGEVLRDEGERGEWLYYTVVSIHPNTVGLEISGGESFQIGLFDHQREKRKAQSKKTDRIQVVVGGKEPKEGSAQRTGPKAGEQEPDESSQPGSSQEAEGNATPQGSSPPDSEPGQDQGPDQEESSQPRGLAEVLKQLGQRQKSQESPGSLSSEERERRVEEGSMKKVETPFGTIYRPVN